ncbi:MAG: DUF2147 domain-containing protein [Pseudolabrys sp.]|nr:DUF2147 domain-containing protein [Pseudolabrys sp.]MBV9262636.1 DUF2147 domain-containing protein [Pseudolabrys sp.]
MPATRWLPALFALLLTATAASGDDINTPAGDWLVAKKYARIRVADCGGQLWGVVVWETQPGIDNKNPDPKLRGRPTLGMPILLSMAPSQSNQWSGQIYNSQDGNTYSANISLLNPNTLKVQGCFLGFLCGGENWTRILPNSPEDQRMQVAAPTRNSRATNGSAPTPSGDVCLDLFGATRLPH